MGGGLTTYRTITNAPTVDLLEGTGYEFGGSAGAYIVGVPIVGGVDFNKMDDPDGKKSYYGTTTNCGIGVPGYELHSGAGETLSFSQFNIFDLLDQVCIRIME